MKNRKGERSGVWLVCPCGKTFYRWQSKAARSRTCSKVCHYKYKRPRPSGLVYKIVSVNSAWFKKGVEVPRVKGLRPWNFKGEDVGYCSIHDWVKRHYGKAAKCEHCGKTDGRIHWANISWTYQRDISDWMQLCSKCHQKYDRAGGWGLATQKFGNEMRRGR